MLVQEAQQLDCCTVMAVGVQVNTVAVEHRTGVVCLLEGGIEIETGGLVRLTERRKMSLRREHISTIIAAATRQELRLVWEDDYRQMCRRVR